MKTILTKGHFYLLLQILIFISGCTPFSSVSGIISKTAASLTGGSSSGGNVTPTDTTYDCTADGSCDTLPAASNISSSLSMIYDFNQTSLGYEQRKIQKLVDGNVYLVTQNFMYRANPATGVFTAVSMPAVSTLNVVSLPLNFDNRYIFLMYQNNQYFLHNGTSFREITSELPTNFNLGSETYTKAVLKTKVIICSSTDCHLYDTNDLSFIGKIVTTDNNLNQGGSMSMSSSNICELDNGNIIIPTQNGLELLPSGSNPDPNDSNITSSVGILAGGSICLGNDVYSYGNPGGGNGLMKSNADLTSHTLIDSNAYQSDRQIINGVIYTSTSSGTLLDEGLLGKVVNDTYVPISKGVSLWFGLTNATNGLSNNMISVDPNTNEIYYKENGRIYLLAQDGSDSRTELFAAYNLTITDIKFFDTTKIVIAENTNTPSNHDYYISDAGHTSLTKIIDNCNDSSNWGSCQVIFSNGRIFLDRRDVNPAKAYVTELNNINFVEIGNLAEAQRTEGSIALRIVSYLNELYMLIIDTDGNGMLKRNIWKIDNNVTQIEKLASLDGSAVVPTGFGGIIDQPGTFEANLMTVQTARYFLYTDMQNGTINDVSGTTLLSGYMLAGNSGFEQHGNLYVTIMDMMTANIYLAKYDGTNLTQLDLLLNVGSDQDGMFLSLANSLTYSYDGVLVIKSEADGYHLKKINADDSLQDIGLLTSQNADRFSSANFKFIRAENRIYITMSHFDGAGLGTGTTVMKYDGQSLTQIYSGTKQIINIKKYGAEFIGITFDNCVIADMINACTNKAYFANFGEDFQTQNNLASYDALNQPFQFAASHLMMIIFYYKVYAGESIGYHNGNLILLTLMSNSSVKVYKSDGTTMGTSEISLPAEVSTHSDYSMITSIVQLPGKVLFRLVTDDYGSELYSFDSITVDDDCGACSIRTGADLIQEYNTN